MKRVQRQQSRKSFRVWMVIIILLALFEAALHLFGFAGIDDFMGALLDGNLAAGAVAPGPTEGTLEVHVLDVGQGDCILIRGSDKTILVDASVSDAAPGILSYLRKLGVDGIDILINTHPHNDHFGGMRAVMDGMPTARVLMTHIPEELTPTTVSFEKLVTYLGKHQIPTAEARVGDTYDLGGGGVLTIVGPQKTYDDLNNSSLVCRVDFGRHSFLLTGDMEAKAEKDLLASGVPLRADVLKVGHHGSNTSSSRDFLKAVDPDYAVISCGADNDYGHPHDEVLERLRSRGITIYRTDLDGAAVFVTDGDQLSVSTAK